MQFPSVGSIITKEMGPRNAVPAHVLVPKWDRTRQYEEYFRASFLGGEYDPMCIPDPSRPGFEVTDLSLPKTVSQAAIDGRSAFLKAVDRQYRALNETAEHTNMDAFTFTGVKDDSDAGSARRVRSFEGVGEDQGALRQGLSRDSRFC